MITAPRDSGTDQRTVTAALPAKRRHGERRGNGTPTGVTDTSLEDGLEATAFTAWTLTKYFVPSTSRGTVNQRAVAGSTVGFAAVVGTPRPATVPT